jgi:hypothetical protein
MTGVEAVPVGTDVTEWSGKVACERGLVQFEGLITVAITVDVGVVVTVPV